EEAPEERARPVAARDVELLRVDEGLGWSPHERVLLDGGEARSGRVIRHGARRPGGRALFDQRQGAASEEDGRPLDGEYAAARLERDLPPVLLDPRRERE